MKLGQFGRNQTEKDRLECTDSTENRGNQRASASPVRNRIGSTDIGSGRAFSMPFPKLRSRQAAVPSERRGIAARVAVLVKTPTRRTTSTFCQTLRLYRIWTIAVAPSKSRSSGSETRPSDPKRGIEAASEHRNARHHAGTRGSVASATRATHRSLWRPS